VNQLIKQFGEMRKMMKSPHKMKSNMMKQMGGGRRTRRHDEGHGRQVPVLNYRDTLIRDAGHFANAVRYIRRNPAKLQQGTFTLWQSERALAIR
jgi:hypothetical protein